MTFPKFSTRTLMNSVEIAKRPRMFLRDTFFPNTFESNSEYVDVDIFVGKRRVAPFVSPLHEGRVIERQGFTTSSFKPAYIKEKTAYNPQDFFNRMMGEQLHLPSQSPAARIEMQLNKDIEDLLEMIDRREELMVRDILEDGQITIAGDGIPSSTLNFQRDANHTVTLTGTALWTDAASLPQENLRDWRRLISQNGGRSADVAVLGADVYDALENNTKFQALLDNRRIDTGQVNVRELPDGVTAIGSLFGGALDLFTYDEWYIDPADGVEKPMMPVNKVIVGSSRSRATRHYGAIQDMAAGLIPTRAWPKSWDEEDPSVRWVMVQSAPLPVPHETNAFVAATVI